MKQGAWIGLSLVIAPALAVAQMLPEAGMWEISSDVKGVPGGGGVRSSPVCLKGETLAMKPEKTIIDAAAQARAGRGKTPPSCELNDLVRTEGSSRWKTVCEGPMGKLEGAGTAKLGAQVVQIDQTLTAKAFFGSLTMQQSISGKRSGGC